MKKLVSLLLAATMIMSMVACGSSSSSSSASSSTAATSTEATQSDTSQSDEQTAQASTNDGDTIKIGVLCYLSSTRSATLGFFQIGWEAAAEEINAAGGIDGKNIEFLLYDPQSDAAQVSQRLTEAKNDGCVAVLFTSGDDLAPTAAEWAEENQFPVILESNTSTEVTIKHYSKYCFNVGPNAWAFAKILALSAVGDEGKKNFVFCGTDGAATIDAENLLILEGQKINPDFTCLASYRVSTDDSEFSNIISQIASTAPDMVLQQGGGPTFVSFAQQGLMFGLFDVSDVYNDFVVDTSTNSTLAETGDYPYGSTKGMFLLNFWDESLMDENIKGFCDSYMANEICQANGYVAPSDSGLSCYRGIKAIALGVQACVDAGTDYTDPQTLTDAIKNVEWSDSTGDHYFRDLDNQLTFDYYYGVSSEEGSEAYNGNPIATDIITYSSDDLLPTEQEMKDYAESLGVTDRF
jgi:ABC-type branched-subunit amino acid transport system substrate-binding protein